MASSRLSARSQPRRKRWLGLLNRAEIQRGSCRVGEDILKGSVDALGKEYPADFGIESVGGKKSLSGTREEGDGGAAWRVPHVSGKGEGARLPVAKRKGGRRAAARLGPRLAGLRWKRKPAGWGKGLGRGEPVGCRGRFLGASPLFLSFLFPFTKLFKIEIFEHKQIR